MSALTRFKDTGVAMLTFSKEKQVTGRDAMIVAIVLVLVAFTLGAYMGQRRQLAAIEEGKVYKYMTKGPADAVYDGKGIKFRVDDGDGNMSLYAPQHDTGK